MLKPRSHRPERVTGFSSVSSQGLDMSRHRVCFTESSTFFPLWWKVCSSKVSSCIASVWERPCQTPHAYTHRVEKLPMGCISDRGIIGSVWRKLYLSERSFPCLFHLLLSSQRPLSDKCTNRLDLYTEEIIKLQNNLLHLACGSFHMLFWNVFSIQFSVQI